MHSHFYKFGLTILTTFLSLSRETRQVILYIRKFVQLGLTNEAIWNRVLYSVLYSRVVLAALQSSATTY